MGEVVLGECMTNTLYADDHLRALSSSELSWEQCIWEAMLQLLVEGHAMEASTLPVELMKEDGDEEREGAGEARRRGSSTTSSMVP